MNIRQLINTNGNPAANQFVISNSGGVYFQSYNSVVAKIANHGNIALSTDWEYSNTTRKHLYTFLRQQGFDIYDNAKAIRSAIKDGRIVLKNVESLNID